MRFFTKHTLLFVVLLGFFPLSANSTTPGQKWFPKTKPYEWRSELHDATYTDLATQTLVDWEQVDGITATQPSSRWGQAGQATVQVRRNYVYIQDNDRSFSTPFRSQRDFIDAFQFTTNELYGVVPQEHIFVIVFTAFETGVGAFFYQPQANTARGIGYPQFDNNGSGNPLEGLIFMNYWKIFDQLYGQAGPDVVQGFSRHTFNQEVGHRWVVTFEGQGPNLMDLLGRDQAHWSYFMNSNGSPMEGNWWKDNGNGSFTTRTNYNNWYYNTLDLYLMGMKSIEEVEPWFLITGVDTTGATDLQRRAPTPPSPPQILFPQTVRGTRVDYDITDITAAYGTRYPPKGTAPTTFRTVFVMLASQNAAMSESQKVEFENMVDSYVEGFRAGTDYEGDLDYALTADVGLPIGARCNDVADCDAAESNICTQPQSSDNKICSLRCTTESVCPTDWCCQASADGSNMCLPTALCLAAAPDAGITNPGTDGGTAMSGDDAGATAVTCTCDVDTACTEGCTCDPECYARNDCACDVTDICDPDCESCDPECLYGDTGCSGCSTVASSNESESSRNNWPLATALLLIGLVAWRRRR